MRKFLGIVALVVGLIGFGGQAEAQLFSSVQTSNGSCASPAYTFTNDKTSGFYLSGAGTIGLCISGVQVGTFNSNGIAMDNNGKPVSISQVNGTITANGT